MNWDIVGDYGIPLTTCTSGYETGELNSQDRPITWNWKCFQEADPVRFVFEKNRPCRNILHSRGTMREPENFYSQQLITGSSELLPDSRWKEKKGRRPRGVNEIKARSRGNRNHTLRLNAWIWITTRTAWPICVLEKLCTISIFKWLQTASIWILTSLLRTVDMVTEH